MNEYKEQSGPEQYFPTFITNFPGINAPHVVSSDTYA